MLEYHTGERTSRKKSGKRERRKKNGKADNETDEKRRRRAERAR
jgi:hypothetical protein